MVAVHLFSDWLQFSLISIHCIVIDCPCKSDPIKEPTHWSMLRGEVSPQVSRQVFGMHSLKVLLLLAISVGFPSRGQSSSFSCAGKPDGDYPDPSNCNGFITCSNGLTNHMPCPAGLVWNDAAKLCDWDYNVPPPCGTATPTCDEGWFLFGDHCYFFNHDTSGEDWNAAKQACQNRGAQLAEIRSEYELQFVNSHLIQGGYNQYMIGITDAASEGQWKYTDGTDVTFFKWKGGEPNGGTSENCGTIFARTGAFGLYNDGPCNFKYGKYICKK